MESLELEPFLTLIEKAKTDVSSLKEEETKNAFVIPFFQKLGYDPTNANEFRAEYYVPNIKKQSEDGKREPKNDQKIDYVILDDEGNPLILVEAKRASLELDKYYSQLYFYFLAVPSAHLAILTNGIEYRFYLDSDNTNIMDIEPFHVINLSEFDDSQLSFLEKIKKGQVDIDAFRIDARKDEYKQRARALLEKQMTAPDDDFVSYFIANIYDGKKTQKAIDAFRDIAGESISGIIKETVNERLRRALEAESPTRPAPYAQPATRRERLEMERRSFRYYVGVAVAAFLLSGAFFFCYAYRSTIYDYTAPLFALLMQRLNAP